MLKNLLLRTGVWFAFGVLVTGCSIEPFPSESDLIGSWTIVASETESVWIHFHEDGIFSVHRGGKRADAFIRGTYALSRGEIEFLNTDGQFSAACEKPGKYRLLIDEESLKLKPLEDYCPSRKKFTSNRWIRRAE